MCRVETIVLAAVLLVEGGALHMYPEIFDPSKFLARPLPLRAPRERTAATTAAVGDGDAHFTGGFKDGEVGFVRSSSESGKGGFRHRENFHQKDGNRYGHEKQTGAGESKRTGEAKKVAAEGAEHGRLMVDTDHYRPEPTYEVIEEQSDVENPDKHKKYGTGSEKDKKKPTEAKPEKAAKQSAPKDRSNQKKNHNGYESIVYHENERGSTEHGYGKRKATGKLPEDRQPAKQMVAHDEEEAFEEEDGDDRDEGVESSERDYEHQYDSDGGEAGRESDFDDNYEGLRFDTDFERSFGSEEHGGDEVDGGKKGSGRAAGRQEQDEDYDAEVDRDEVDETASEDKYRGGEDDEDEEEGGDDRQYEYASEADGDAQDY